MSAFSRRPLQLVPDEPDQILRLRDFRAAHPGVVIGSGGFETWQALIREPDGETVITRYTLRDLLDKLDELLRPGQDRPRGGPG